jgi:16S rRNA (uracil1498-N3)-methyltransferase
MSLIILVIIERIKMPKIRLFFKENIIQNKLITLDNDKFHYLKNVMRKKENDKILIFNENEEWSGRLKLEEKKAVIPEHLIKRSEAIPDIWLCFALIKSKNINYLIEKVTEIGLKKIIPIETTFSEKYTPNYQRLQKVCIEAVEQSESMYVPKIERKKKLYKLLENWDPDRAIIFCDEERRGKNILTIPIQEKKKLAIFIGPVGGWSTDDRKGLKNLNFFNVTLGNNVLKVDTACIVSLSSIRNLL